MNTVTVGNTADNMTPVVVGLLRTCTDDTVIQFKKGTYDFYAEGCLTEYFCPACNQSGEKDIVFPVFSKKNIVIDGGGSLFVFHDRVFPFIAYRSENVTFRNFAVTFSFMRYCAADTHPTADGVGISIDSDKYDYYVNDRGNLVFRCGDTEFSSGEKVFFAKQDEDTFCFIKAGEMSATPENLPADILSCTAEKTDDGVFLRYLPGNCFTGVKEGRIVVNYDEDRANGVIYSEFCKDVKVEGVTVFRAAGMGIVSQRCENVEIDRVSFIPGEKGDEVYSSTADALFFTNCTGRVLIHNSRITHTMDDALSVHNIYSRVSRMITDNKFEVRYGHKAHAGYRQYVKGDRLTVTDGKSGCEKGFVTVKSARMTNDTYSTVIETEEDISPVIQEADYIENHFCSPEVIIEHNTFDYIPHLRFGTAEPIILRNNFIMNSTGVEICDMPQDWHAYGKTEDVFISGNRFINCEYAVRTGINRPAGHCVYHEKIAIWKNLAVNCRRGYILNNIRKLEFRGNGFAAVEPEKREEMNDVLSVDRADLNQLLMRRDSAPFTPTPLPDGYRRFTFRRGGCEEMSMEEYIKAWFRIEPYWTMDEFNSFYNDDQLPEDGHFLILDENGKVAAHSNILINQRREGTDTVHFVSVGEQYRGRRLGYCVSEMVLDYAEKHNCPTLYLTTDEFRIPALKIYLRLGFLPVFEDACAEERWIPIMKMFGYTKYYDHDENVCSLNDDEEIDIVAARIMDRFRPAFEELAK